MSTLYHTPITTGNAANAATINAPLGQLDSAITTAVAQAALAQEAVINAGTAATLTNGAANAGQKVVTVDASSMFVAGATVEYALVGGVIETNTVASVDGSTQITLTTNIGTGGIANNSLVAVVPVTYANLKAGVYNVLDYGASPSASAATNATAMQAALNAASANDTVIIPAGTYAYGTTLTLATNGVHLRSSGGIATLNFSGTGNALTITSHDNRLSDLYITTAAHANAGHGIYLNGAYVTRMDNVTVAGVQRDGVNLTGAWSCLFVNCLFDARDSDATYVGFRNGTAGNNNMFLRCRFFGGTSNTGCIVEDGGQVGFQGCDFSGDGGTSVGLALKSGYATEVRNNYFETNGAKAIWIGSDTDQPVGVDVRNNFINIATTANNVGLYVSKCYECLVENNTFFGDNATGSEGIHVVGSDDDVFGLRIGHNYIAGAATAISDTKGRAATSYGQRMSWGSTAPTDGGLWAKGDIVWNTNPATGSASGWVCLTAGAATKGNWTNSTVYAAGDYVIGADNKLYYTAAGGTSNGSTPANDTGVTWSMIATSQTLAVFEAFGQVNTRAGVANPSGSVTPYYLGEIYLDQNASKVYIAINTSTSGWVALN